MGAGVVHGFIATGGLFFWTIIAIELAILFRCMADSYGTESYNGETGPTGSGIIATISVGVVLGIFFIFGDWSVGETWSGICANVSWLLWGVGLYLAIGIPWSIFQAWFAAKMRGEPYRNAKIDWLRQNGVKTGSTIPTNLLAKWQDNINASKNFRLKTLSETPYFANQKARIFRTMAYWPMSMGYFFLADMFAQVFKAICMRLRDVYQKVIDIAYKDIREDFRKPPATVETEMLASCNTDSN